jgi:CubicO group peptidase (beta-lactamase class C family)
LSIGAFPEFSTGIAVASPRFVSADCGTQAMYASHTMKQQIAERILRAIEEKIFPGCVVGFVLSRGKPTVMAFGYHTLDADSRPMTENSIFDVASITKAIPTSSLALRCLDRGWLDLNDTLIKYVPEFSNSHREKVLIRHLLTQTLNYNFRLSALKDSGPQGILDAILSTEFPNEPGSTFFYANATSILLGMVVEKLYGECLAVTAQREFFGPLGMAKTSFFPEQFPKQEIVPTEIDPWRGKTVQGAIHDESAFVLRKIMVAGSAGLFSTGPDIMRFLNMLLNNGVWGGKRYFSSHCMDQIQTNQIAHLGLQGGLGWELEQNRYMGRRCPKKTIGKTGFTGCVCMCNIPGGAAMVLLSNCTFPKRRPDSQAIDAVRRDVADIVFGALNR